MSSLEIPRAHLKAGEMLPWEHKGCRGRAHDCQLKGAGRDTEKPSPASFYSFEQAAPVLILKTRNKLNGLL